MNTNLIKYEAACRALAECKSVDEVKSWADKAAAMQAYGRMANDRTLEVDAAEIRIRAERRLGEMLAATKAEGGLNPAATLKQGPVVVSNDHGKRAPTLAQAGISKDLSSRAQKLAAVPEAQFEAELAAKRERDRQEGARVSARLEAAGAKALKQKAKEPEMPDGPSLSELVDELQAENERLHADIKAAQADDLRAEAIKWRRAYDAAQRTASEKMDVAARLERELQGMSNRLLRIGKLFGERDAAKVPALVEAFYRQHTKEAA